jgi:hypothetical protein
MSFAINLMVEMVVKVDKKSVSMECPYSHHVFHSALDCDLMRKKERLRENE